MANAIESPRTMMVHLKHTSVARLAMVSSGWFLDLALVAPSFPVTTIRSIVLWRSSWQFRNGHGVRYPYHGDIELEPNLLRMGHVMGKYKVVRPIGKRGYENTGYLS